MSFFFQTKNVVVACDTNTCNNNDNGNNFLTRAQQTNETHAAAEIESRRRRLSRSSRIAMILRARVHNAGGGERGIQLYYIFPGRNKTSKTPGPLEEGWERWSKKKNTLGYYILILNVYIHCILYYFVREWTFVYTKTHKVYIGWESR